MNDLFRYEQESDNVLIFTDHQEPMTLCAIELMNWGTFDNIHCFEFDSESTCITGVNGAGKSTAIDAYNTLLNPTQSLSFNAAVGTEKKSERSPISYMRGKIGDKLIDGNSEQNCKRSGAMVSSVLARFERDDGVKITIGSYYVLKATTSSMSEVDRVYFVAQQHITITQLNSWYAGKSVRNLIAILNDYTDIYATSSFNEYQIRMLDTFRISNANAPALLQVAMGIKSLSNINDLVQNLVLPKTNFLAPAKQVVEAFGTLKVIRQRILDDKNKLSALEPLIDIQTEYTNINERVCLLTEVVQSVHSYLNICRLPLYQKDHKKIELAQEQAQEDLFSIETDIDLKKAALKDAQIAYVDAGGDQIENVREQHAMAKRDLDKAKEKNITYSQLLMPLDMKVPDTLANFEAQQQQFASLEEGFNLERDTLIEQQGEKKYQCSRLEKLLSEEQTNLALIAKKKDSNIRPNLQTIRDSMVESLGLERLDALFIAEFIDVRPEHEEWRGAIERALGARRQTLFVHNVNKDAIQGWLDSRYLGARIEVRFFEDVPSSPADFKRDGFLRKLEWREHPYRDAVKHFLANSDLVCVDDLKGHDYALTINGSIKRGRQHFLKDDRHRIDDKDEYFLGFTNEKRLELVQNKVEQLSKEHADAMEAHAKLKVASTEINQNLLGLSKLTAYKFEELDVSTLEKAFNSLSERLEALEKTSVDAMQAKQLMDKLEGTIKELDDKRIHKSGDIREIQVRLDRTEENIQKIEAKIPSKPLEELVQKELSLRFSKLDEGELVAEPLFLGDDQKYNSVYSDLEQTRNRCNTLKQQAQNVTERFIELWPIDYDLSPGIDYLDDYLKVYKKIEEDELPSAEEDFKEHLSRNSTDALTGLNTAISQQERDYIEIIDDINDLLEEMEFRPSTNLRILPERLNQPTVESFDKKVAMLADLSLTLNYDAVYHKLDEIINDPDEGLALLVKNPYLVASKQVLDPRNRFTFKILEETEDEDADPFVFQGTGSLSGGEAETCAALIVAASLHYVLMPNGINQTPMLSAVFIDEAFSNLSSDNAIRIVKAYKKMGLTLHLIAPPERLSSIDGAINSVILVRKNVKTNSSSHARISWEQALELAGDS